MDELSINYGISNGKKITNIVIGGYLALFTLYFCIVEGVASRFSILFFVAMIGFVLAAILVLSNTLWLPRAVLKIDNTTVTSNLSVPITIEWTNVSQVNIGVSYIIFSLNGGQKQRKIDLSPLVYDDLKAVKSKVIELCGHKNIAYQND